MSSQFPLNLPLIAKLLPDLDYTDDVVMKIAHQIKSCYITFKCQQVYDLYVCLSLVCGNKLKGKSYGNKVTWKCTGKILIQSERLQDFMLTFGALIFKTFI